ncbi:shufflon protein C' [Escherichia coli]
MNHFIGGKSGGSIYYKPIQCPTGYIMTGTRMYGIGDGVDVLVGIYLLKTTKG